MMNISELHPGNACNNQQELMISSTIKCTANKVYDIIIAQKEISDFVT